MGQPIAPYSMRHKVILSGTPPQQDAKRALPMMQYNSAGQLVPAMRTNKKGNRVPRVRMVTAASVEQWRTGAQFEARAQMRGKDPLAGLVEIEAKLYFKRPKNEGVGDPVLAGCTPDFDNAAKIFDDALKGIVFGDDRTIAIARIEKWYTASEGFGPTEPRTEVEAWEVDKHGRRK